MNIDKIIDDAFALYCPQIRYEISELTKFLVEMKGDEPWNILEIGTKFGGTFHIWNSINPNGMNISIDMSDGGVHGGISEEEMDKRDFNFMGSFANCHFIRGDSHSKETMQDFSCLIEGLSHGQNEIDFLFIDGDHTFHGVEQDWEMYSPFVKKGGIVVFHDIVISERHHERNVYVGEFWKELTRLRMPDNPNICMIDSEEYEILNSLNPEMIGQELEF